VGEDLNADAPHRVPHILLLEVEPDLGRYLTAEEMVAARGLTVPVMTSGRGEIDVEAQLRESRAFGAVIADGALMHRLAVGDHPALRLLGPGDILSAQGFAAGPISRSSYSSPGPVRLALLDDRILLAAQRFPRLFAGLHARMAEQHQRLAAQLVICQLPRVEDRILSMLWLLAETWGRVTHSGTVLPVALTHDAIGECIGARRPTVSLALKELTARGAIVRQDHGWLLLQQVPGSGDAVVPGRDGGFEVDDGDEAVWSEASLPSGPAIRSEAMSMMISALHDSHVHAEQEARRRIARSRTLRARSIALREQIATGQHRRRPAP
jgi:CRP-like cAMP-binding protein